MNHRWEPVGREWDSPLPNLWQCSRCGMVKAVTETERGIATEFSTAEGQVLVCGHRHAPGCGNDAYRERKEDPNGSRTEERESW